MVANRRGAFLLRELGEVSHSQQAMFCLPLRRARQHLTRTLRAFHDRLAAHVQAAVGVTLAPREFSLEVPEPAAPPVEVSYAFDAALEQTLARTKSDEPRLREALADLAAAGAEAARE